MALRYNSNKESPEEVAKEFFVGHLEENKKAYNTSCFFYEIYERETGNITGDKFVLMYSFRGRI